MFLKEFEIRWNDLDANRHLANKAYIEYAAHTRMSFLNQAGFNQQSLAKYNIGPVIFYEHIYYFKEVFAGKPIKVSLELTGLSEDGLFFEFTHNYYDHNGQNFATYEMMGGWIDLKERKLTGLPENFSDLLQTLDKSTNFRVLTKEDTRKHMKKPMPLS
ncbi:thioesterase family protein [Aquimarina sp. ERC-38]|uniref:acyl-CoA thioesterase n=1 Tax=Aquimarina sp. ERC-38 TaxID=2949996 RepID=UPI002247F6A6|nr:thioesterase family protein [Aquimarina sp. ERC-38]UZO82042.1 thioesterase family protein [Aquimarina sp. ERC-38]